MAKKRRTYSEAELLNDPSLKFYCYHSFECLLHDSGEDIRFVRYEGDGGIVVADLQTMKERPGSVPATSVRRRTVQIGMSVEKKRMIHDSIVTAKGRTKK